MSERGGAEPEREGHTEEQPDRGEDRDREGDSERRGLAAERLDDTRRHHAECDQHGDERPEPPDLAPRGSGRVDARRERAADSARQQQREEEHREPVDRVPEEDDQPLHLRDLDAHEAEADRQEVEQPRRGAPGDPLAGQRERQDQEEERHDERDHEQRGQDAHRPRVVVAQPREPAAQGGLDRQRVEEERAIVGRRREVEGRARARDVAARERHQPRVRGLLGAQQDGEAQRVRGGAQRGEVARRERRRAREQGRHPHLHVRAARQVGHEGEMRQGIRRARLAQRLRGQGEQPLGLGGLSRQVPARERDEPVRGEPREEDLPRLGRVERVLREDEGAGGSRRPGVDERHLDQVDGLLEPRDVAPRLVVDEAHARVAVEVAGEVAEAPVQRVEQVGVDLDTQHRPLAEAERREHVATASHADHQHAGVRAEVMREVGHVVGEVVDGAEVAVEVRHHGPGVRVDLEGELAHLGPRRDRARPPDGRRPRDVGVAARRDVGVGAPALEERTHLLSALQEPRPQPGAGLAVQREEDGPAEQEQRRPGRGRAQARGPGGGEEPGGHRGDACHGDHGDGRVCHPEQGDDEEAPEARAGQVGRVEPADLEREAREREAYHRTGEHERDGDHGVREAEIRDGRGEGSRGRARVGESNGSGAREVGNLQVHEEAHRGREGEGERAGCERRLGPLRGEAPRTQEDPRGPCREPEHGDRDRHEGEVVPERHAEDPGQEHLEHQRRERDPEEARVGPRAGPLGLPLFAADRHPRPARALGSAPRAPGVPRG
ncbi:MAG TPA: hypothetical protein VMH82_11305 [Myxococcota bacterium]|nr:hypothetical protein [Myxococcota bacterium]